jgi:hypothetical protein
MIMLAQDREPFLFTALEEQLIKYKQLHHEDQQFKEVEKVTERVT